MLQNVLHMTYMDNKDFWKYKKNQNQKEEITDQQWM
jgi:hypothetical protein